MTLVSERDWTVGNAVKLLLWFRGEPNNAAEPMYVALNGGAVVYHDDPGAAQIDTWTQWTIDLQDFAAQGVNLANVNTITIGFGDKNNLQAGGSGMVFFDDIRVGNPIPPVGLVAYYALENNVEDSSGNEHHGTIVGGPVFVEGPAGLGMAMEFDGTGSQYVDLGTFDSSAITGQLTVALWSKWNGLNGSYQGLIGKRDTWSASEMMWQFEAHQDTGVMRFGRSGAPGGDQVDSGLVLTQGQWEHWCATFDGTTAIVYLNGEEVVRRGFSFGSDPEAAVQFGACEADGGNPFNGALDEVRLYDIVLSVAEILQLAGK